MPTISRAFTCHPSRYSAGGNNPRYIVVHYTANDAPARNEANNVMYNNDGRKASAQYYLDGHGVIYQLMEDTDTAYAVGAWPGNTQYIGNSESISIEVCNDGGPFSIDEIAELRWLVQLLMERHGIPESRVVRHYDCHGGPAGRKACPLWYTPDGGGGDAAWETLRDTITREELMKPQDVWNCPVAYQDPKTGKQVNKAAWELLSWGGHYEAYMAPKVSDIQTKVADLQNRVIKLEKAQGEQTGLIKTVQKTLNTIVKKLA